MSSPTIAHSRTSDCVRRGEYSSTPFGRVAPVLDLLDEIERWQSQGHRVALARVVDLKGSGPRDPGAAMAVCETGEVRGSVAGGCVEGAVVSEALEVLKFGTPKLCTFSYSDDEAFSVGLTCGGTITIYLEPVY